MTNRSFQFINQLLYIIDVLLEVHEVGEQTCNYSKSLYLESGSFMQKFHELSSTKKVRRFSVIKKKKGEQEMGNARIS